VVSDLCTFTCTFLSVIIGVYVPVLYLMSMYESALYLTSMYVSVFLRC